MATISTHTQLNPCVHSSIELRNTSTRKSAAALRSDRFKLSILICLFLQYPLPWAELEPPAGLTPSIQGTDNPAEAGDKCSGLHLHFRLAFWKSGPKVFDYKLRSKLHEVACKKWHPNIESLKRSLWKAAPDFPVDVYVIQLISGHKDLRTACVLMVVILNNYLWFWLIMHPCCSCY